MSDYRIWLLIHLDPRLPSRLTSSNEGTVTRLTWDLLQEFFERCIPIRISAGAVLRGANRSIIGNRNSAGGVTRILG